MKIRGLPLYAVDHATRYSHHETRPTNNPSATTNQHSESGIALVIVMIAIFVLAVLAAGFAY